MPHIEEGPYFPLYVNDDGTIGKKVADLGNGGYIKVNDARMVGTMISVTNKFNMVCEEFHEKLISFGVKAYRCNDGWVDRRRCIATIRPSERTKGYYWYGLAEVGDKIFIGNAHDGGRMAEVLKVEDGYGYGSIKYHYKPLEMVIDGANSAFVTKNNAPKYTLWDRIRGKEKPYLKTDIYEVWTIPERCCVRCRNFDSECNFCYRSYKIDNCFTYCCHHFNIPRKKSLQELKKKLYEQQG